MTVGCSLWPSTLVLDLTAMRGTFFLPALAEDCHCICGILKGSVEVSIVILGALRPNSARQPVNQAIKRCQHKFNGASLF